MNIKLSLIISFYNKIERLKWVFVALERQTFKEFEVVIADDGSNAQVVEQLKDMIAAASFPVKHIWHEDSGWQKNKILNAAVNVAVAPLLVFIDGDCVPTRRFLEDHYSVAKRGEVSTGRRVMLTDAITKSISEDKINSGYLESCTIFWQLLYETIFCGRKTKMEQMFRVKPAWLRKIFVKEKSRFILGCNYSIYIEDLLKVKGFDERFVNPGYGEDIDLGNRLERYSDVKLMSRKRLMIIYHTYHEHFFMDTPENLALLEENKLKPNF